MTDPFFRTVKRFEPIKAGSVGLRKKRGAVLMVLRKRPIGVEKQLIEVLTQIRDDTNFILGVRACLKTDEERQTVLAAIDSGAVVRTSDILSFAYNIHLKRKATR